MPKLLSVYEQAQVAATFLRERNPFPKMPDCAAILGSGFKGYADAIDVKQRIPFADIPHFIAPTVAGHGGELIFAQDHHRNIVVMTGRIHLYEGHHANAVVHPVRTLGLCGIKHVVLTNAAGGLDPRMQPGTVVVIEDQLNLTGQNCLVGSDSLAFGKQFVDMINAYDHDWTTAVIAKHAELQRGIYAGCLGPTYETVAETRWLSTTGATVVGMSTVLECIAARQLGMKVLGLSLVTNLAAGLSTKIDHEEVLSAGQAAKQKLAAIMSSAWATIDC